MGVKVHVLFFFLRIFFGQLMDHVVFSAGQKWRNLTNRFVSYSKSIGNKTFLSFSLLLRFLISLCSANAGQSSTKMSTTPQLRKSLHSLKLTARVSENKPPKRKFLGQVQIHWKPAGVHGNLLKNRFFFESSLPVEMIHVPTIHFQR